MSELSVWGPMHDANSFQIQKHSMIRHAKGHWTVSRTCSRQQERGHKKLFLTLFIYLPKWLNIKGDTFPWNDTWNKALERFSRVCRWVLLCRRDGLLKGGRWVLPAHSPFERFEDSKNLPMYIAMILYIWCILYEVMYVRERCIFNKIICQCNMQLAICWHINTHIWLIKRNCLPLLSWPHCESLQRIPSLCGQRGIKIFIQNRNHDGYERLGYSLWPLWSDRSRGSLILSPSPRGGMGTHQGRQAETF